MKQHSSDRRGGGGDHPRSAGQTTPLSRLLKQIEKIASSPDPTLRGLAHAAGLDPERDFTGLYLNGLPLADQDITGFNFSGSDLRGTGVERAHGKASCRFDGALFDGPSLDPKVISFNKHLRDGSYLQSESSLREALARPVRQYDVISFTTLIRRAPSEERAAHWFEEMPKAGVAPNVHTFATLMNKSPSEERAAHWFEEMRKAGVAPDDPSGR